jgi:hypothetical protein
MSEKLISRPDPSEYAAYYGKYVSLVPDGQMMDLLEANMNETVSFLSSIPESRTGFRYAEGKWSIKEVLGHVNDTERVFAYRALRIARNDTTPLPGFDQEGFVRSGRFDQRDWKSLIEEFKAIRKSTIFLFEHFPEEAWSRKGTASNNPVTVRAIAWILIGHGIHHLQILRERYLQ